MTMTDAELAEIRARVEAATPGEWWVMPDYEDPVLYVETTSHGGYFVCGLDDNRPDDAAFIAAARTDIPALLDEVAAMRKENERLREAVKAVVNSTELCSAFCHVARAKQVLSWYPAALYSATEDADDRTT